MINSAARQKIYVEGSTRHGGGPLMLSSKGKSMQCLHTEQAVLTDQKPHYGAADRCEATKQRASTGSNEPQLETMSV
jgi:hypothetical protein